MTLPATQTAAVLVGPGRLEIQEIPTWPIADYGDDDLVLIEVAAVGVCGSDFRYFAGENPWAQHTLGRFVPNPPNIVLGHEYAGTVVQVLHPRNEGLLGKRVAPVCSKTCGACPDCRRNMSRLCPHTVHLGHGQGWGEREFYPGAYGRYVPSWGASCYEIPSHVSFEEAAMMDILAVCVHVTEQGAIQPGRPVLVLGAGPAGNGVAQAALARGASAAVLVERSPAALAIARAQGLDALIDSSAMGWDEVAAAALDLAPEGYGSVFDTVGSAGSLGAGLRALGKAGTLVNLAVHDEAMPLNFMALGSERRIVTSCNFEVGDYAVALAWLASGRFRVKEWLMPTTLAELPGWFERTVASPDQKGAFKLVVSNPGR